MAFLKALIDEVNCIGCTKCLPVCPTDAIVGARKMLHTVVAELCTSCENCINVCPTSCIKLKTTGAQISFEEEHRLTLKKQQRLGLVSPENNNHFDSSLLATEARVDNQQKIADAIARVQQRKKRFNHS